MIFPVRCFSCNKVIGDCWLKYQQLVDEETLKQEQSGEKGYQLLNKYYAELDQKIETPQSKALNTLKMTRYCCRRHFLSHVDI